MKKLATYQDLRLVLVGGLRMHSFTESGTWDYKSAPPHTGLTNRAIWALAFCVCSSAAAGVSVVVVAAVANEQRAHAASQQVILVSPADGTVLHFGQLTDSRVEQVKGITYSLDTLLGIERPGSPTSVIKGGSNMSVVDDYEFPSSTGSTIHWNNSSGARRRPRRRKARRRRHLHRRLPL
ncbi:hypothetical protein BJ912DRAFT_1049819 [Pholiota molesta]|nr:hypothetical protein BJ912DRAFT_1049819 [Pholiota molesta]